MKQDEVKSEEAQQAEAAPKGLYAKVCRIIGEIGVIPETGHNDHFNYNYVESDQVVTRIGALLAKYRLAVMPDIESVEMIELPAKQGRERDPLQRVRLTISLIDADTGEIAHYHWVGDGQDAGDKGITKAITSAMKYFLLKTFMVGTGRDDPEATESAPRARRVIERHAPGRPQPPAQSAPHPAPAQNGTAAQKPAQKPAQPPAPAQNGAALTPPHWASEPHKLMEWRSFLMRLGVDEEQAVKKLRVEKLEDYKGTLRQAASVIHAAWEEGEFMPERKIEA